MVNSRYMITSFTALLIAGLTFIATPDASATSISFNGDYTIEDTTGDSFSNQMSFFDLNGPNSGEVSNGDSLTGGRTVNSVTISNLMLSPGAAGSESFAFNPQTYANGFQILDNNNNVLISGDLTVMSLDTVGSSGLINPSLVLNLTNISNPTYNVGEGSTVLDALITAGAGGAGGAVSLTLQFTGDLSDAISSGSTVTNTYSGTLTAVPEPTSLLLLGSGLSGLALAGRRKSKMNKKNKAQL